MEQVLHGIRVLDVSRFKAGPTCGVILADMGADVIRVERPAGDLDRTLACVTADGESLPYKTLNRNKRSVTLNLRNQKGREILKELVKQSDVVLENYGPNVNKRLGFDYESLKKIKPDIIVVAVSGFGQDGPYASRLGIDYIAQAMSGMMSITGFPQSPPLREGAAVIDTATGVYGALGALFALYHREKTGEGQLVDVSLLHSAVFCMDYVYPLYEVLNEILPRFGNAHRFGAPLDTYKAKDGYVTFGVMDDPMWERFLKAVGREELANDPRFQTFYDRIRLENRQFYTDWLSKWVAERTVDEVVKQLNEAFVPCGPVYTIPQVVADPHIRSQEMLVEVEHPGVGKVSLQTLPFKLSKTPAQIKTVAPKLGKHNEEIYCGLLGYTSQELNQLKEEGVV